MKTATAFVACSLFLFSCGGGGDASASSDPAQVPDADVAADDKPIELTDQLMEQYLVIAKEAQAAGNAGNLAFLARHRWSLEQWVKVSGAVSQGMVSASRAQIGEVVATSRATLDKQIVDLEARLKTAPESEREGLKLQIAASRTSRDSMGDLGPVTDLDRRNAEVMKRWMPKLEAAGKTK